MGAMVGPELLIEAAQVRGASGSDPEWLRTVRRFVEDAAGNGSRVRVLAEEESFSPEEAGRLLRVSRSTIRRAIIAGEMKSFKRGTHYRVPVSEVRRLGRKLARETAEFFADDEF